MNQQKLFLRPRQQPARKPQTAVTAAAAAPAAALPAVLATGAAAVRPPPEHKLSDAVIEGADHAHLVSELASVKMLTAPVDVLTGVGLSSAALSLVQAYRKGKQNRQRELAQRLTPRSR